MEYKSYRILQEIHKKLVLKSLRARATIRLFNNRVHDGFLIDVSNNKVYILLENGYVVSYLYTKIKEIVVYGNDMVKKLYNQIINNEQ